MIAILKKFLLETILLLFILLPQPDITPEYFRHFALHKCSNQFQRFIIDRNIKLPQFFHNPEKFFLLTT